MASLDEVVLIFRKSSGLMFDEYLPGYHLYGADICAEARRQGRKSYAISAFCIHNTNIGGILPLEFWKCYLFMRRKWMNSLPIHTPCTRISLSCGRSFAGTLCTLVMWHWAGRGSSRGLKIQARSIVSWLLLDGSSVFRRIGESFEVNHEPVFSRPISLGVRASPRSDPFVNRAAVSDSLKQLRTLLTDLLSEPDRRYSYLGGRRLVLFGRPVIAALGVMFAVCYITQARPSRWLVSTLPRLESFCWWVSRVLIKGELRGVAAQPGG